MTLRCIYPEKWLFYLNIIILGSYYNISEKYIFSWMFDVIMITYQEDTINNDQKLNLIALNKNPYDAQNLDTSAVQEVLREWYGGSLNGVNYEEKPLMLLNGWTQISYLGVHYQAPQLVMEAGYPDGLFVKDFENRFSLRTAKQKESTPTINYFSPQNYFSYDDDPVHCRKHGDSTHFFYPGDWLLECGPLLMVGHHERSMWKVPPLSDQQTIPTLVKALSERYVCDVIEREHTYVLQLPAAELEVGKRITKFSSRMVSSQIVTKFKDDHHKTEKTLVSLLSDIDFQSVYCDDRKVHPNRLEEDHVTLKDHYVTLKNIKLPSTWTTLTTYFTFTLNDIGKYADRLARLGEIK